MVLEIAKPTAICKRSFGGLGAPIRRKLSDAGSNIMETLAMIFIAEICL